MTTDINRYPTVLTIAGSDSGGGAGIQADLKTIAALGAYGTSAITALTAQNTLGVRGIHPVPPEFLEQQLDAVFEDITIDAVKIGMINTVEVARVVAGILQRYKPAFVVFDPVMVSTSGARLIQEQTIETLWTELFPIVDLITPNLDEAEILTGHQIRSVEEMIGASTQMITQGCKSVLLKGGHLVGPVLYDVLALDQQETLTLQSNYIESKNVHGTGCTLSAAIASFMALGLELRSAVEHARIYVAGAIEAGKNVTTGSGAGPLNHTYSPTKMQVRS